MSDGVLTPEEFRAFLLHCSKSPSFFATHVLGVTLWPRQVEILEHFAGNRETVVQACHASGKTFEAAVAGLWWLQMREPSVVFTTAPTWQQVRNLLWEEIATLFAGGRLPTPQGWRPLDGRLLKNCRLEIGPNHFAYGFSTKKVDAAQGKHAANICGILDEASGVEPPMYRAAKANCSAGNARLLVQGNPLDPTSQFAQEARRIGTTFTISVYDTPNFTELGITEQDIADPTGQAWQIKVAEAGGLPYPDTFVAPSYAWDLYHSEGPTSMEYVSRVLGQFPSAATDQLIPLHLIDLAIARWKDYKDLGEEADVKPGGAVQGGIDVADLGDDHSVITIRSGGYVYEQQVYSKQEPPATSGEVVAAVRRFPGMVPVVDAIGVGNEVANRLEEAGIARIKFIASERAVDDEQYHNRRAEGWWALRQQFIDNTIAIPPDPLLREEIAAVKIMPADLQGRRRIEPKEKMMAQIHRSPDRGDSLMMAFAPAVDSGKRARHLFIEGTEDDADLAARERSIEAILTRFGG